MRDTGFLQEITKRINKSCGSHSWPSHLNLLCRLADQRLVVQLNRGCTAAAATGAGGDAAAAKARVRAKAAAASGDATQSRAATLGGLHALTLQLLGLLAHLLARLALLCLAHCLVDLLLVRVHLDEGLDLRQVHTLPVAQGDDLIEGEYQVECVLNNLLLVQRVTVLGYLAGTQQRYSSMKHRVHMEFTQRVLTTLEKRRSVSKSSRMLLAFVVIRSM